jgi:hypothetical protein
MRRVSHGPSGTSSQLKGLPGAHYHRDERPPQSVNERIQRARIIGQFLALVPQRLNLGLGRPGGAVRLPPEKLFVREWLDGLIVARWHLRRPGIAPSHLQAHNLKVPGSNPGPATNLALMLNELSRWPPAA